MLSVQLYGSLEILQCRQIFPLLQQFLSLLAIGIRLRVGGLAHILIPPSPKIERRGFLDDTSVAALRAGHLSLSVPADNGATFPTGIEGFFLAVGASRVFVIETDAAVHRLAVVALAMGLIGIDLKCPNEHIFVSLLISLVYRDPEGLFALGANAHCHKCFF